MLRLLKILFDEMTVSVGFDMLDAPDPNGGETAPLFDSTGFVELFSVLPNKLFMIGGGTVDEDEDEGPARGFENLLLEGGDTISISFGEVF